MLRIGRAQIRKAAGLAGLLLAITLVRLPPIRSPGNRSPMRYCESTTGAQNNGVFPRREKIHPSCLQLGTRVLVIYVRNRMLYEIPPAQITHKVTIVVARNR